MMAQTQRPCRPRCRTLQRADILAHKVNKNRHMRSLGIAIVGPGRMGSILAERLYGAGYRITEIVARDRPASQRAAAVLAKKLKSKVSITSGAQLAADVVWFCVPDGQIRKSAREFESQTNWNQKTALHSSGALASDELAPLRKKGASVASVHPFMTFVAGSIPNLHGVAFGIEGDSKAVAIAAGIAKRLGGEPFLLKKKQKAAYHTWGAFTSPLLVALMVSAQKVAKVAGMKPSETRKTMMPILRQTLANYEELGPAGAFSGPLVRGDFDTIRKHSRVLRKLKGPRAVYRALAILAAENLPVENKKKLMKVLETF